jgi:hypothetical protein
MREPQKQVHKAPFGPEDYQTIESWHREQDAEAQGLTTDEFLEREMELSMEESFYEDDEPRLKGPAFVQWVEESMSAIRHAQAKKHDIEK